MLLANKTLLIPFLLLSFVLFFLLGNCNAVELSTQAQKGLYETSTASNNIQEESVTHSANLTKDVTEFPDDNEDAGGDENDDVVGDDDAEDLDGEFVTEKVPADEELSPTRVKPKPTVTVTATRIGSTRYFTADDVTATDTSKNNSPWTTVLAVPYVAESNDSQVTTTAAATTTTSSSTTTTTKIPIQEPLTTTTTTSVPIITVLPAIITDPYQEEDYVKDWDELPEEEDDNNNNELHSELLPEPEPLVSPAEREKKGDYNEEDELAEALNHNKENTKPELRRHRKRRRRMRPKNLTFNATTMNPLTATNRNGYAAASTLERPNSIFTSSGRYSQVNTPKPYVPKIRMSRRFHPTTTAQTTTPTASGDMRVRMPKISEIAITEVPAPKFSSENNNNFKQPILLQSPLISSFKSTQPADDFYAPTPKPQIEKSVPSPFTESAPSKGIPEAQALSATEQPKGLTSTTSSTTPHNNETGEWLHSENSRHADFIRHHDPGFYGMDRDNWEKNYMSFQQHSFDSPSEEQEEEETPIITLEDLYRQAHSNNHSGMIQMSSPEPKVTVIEHHHMHASPIPQTSMPTYEKGEEIVVTEHPEKSMFDRQGPSPHQHHHHHPVQYHHHQHHQQHQQQHHAPPVGAEGGRGEEAQIFLIEKDETMGNEELAGLPSFKPYPSTTDFKWPHQQPLAPRGSHYDGTKGKSLELEITKAIREDDKSPLMDKPVIVTEIESPLNNGIITEIEYYKEDDGTIPPLSKPVLTQSPPSEPPLPPEYYRPKPTNRYNSVPSSPPSPGLYEPEVHFVDVATGAEIKEPMLPTIKFKSGSGDKRGFMRNLMPDPFQSIASQTYDVSPTPPAQQHNNAIPSPGSYHHFSVDDSRSSPPQPSPTAATATSDKKEVDSSVIEIHHHHFPDGTSYAIQEEHSTRKTPSEENLREDAEIIMGTHWGLNHEHFVPSSRTGLPESESHRNGKNLFRPSKRAPPPSRAPPGRDFSNLQSARFSDPNLHASSSLTLPMPGLVHIPAPPPEMHAMREVTPHQHFPPHAHSMQHQSDYEPANPPLPTAHAYDHHFDHFMQNAGQFKEQGSHIMESGGGAPSDSKSPDYFGESFTEIPYGVRQGPRKKKKKKNSQKTQQQPEQQQQQQQQQQQPSSPNQSPPSVHEDALEYFNPNYPEKEFHPQADYNSGNHVYDDHGSNYNSLPSPPIDHPNYSQDKPYRPDSEYNMENHGPAVHTIGGHEENTNAGHDNENNNKNNDKNKGKEQSTNNIQDLLKQLATTGNQEEEEVSPYSETPYILMFHSTVKAKPKPAPVRPPPAPLVIPFTSKDKVPSASSHGLSGPSSEATIGPGMTVVPVHPRQQMLKVLAAKQHAKKMEALKAKQNKPPAAIFTPYGVLVPVLASGDSVSHAGSSPPKLTALLSAHEAALQLEQLKGDLNKASASSLTNEKSLLRALLGSKTHSDAVRQAKNSRTGSKTFETLLDSLAEKLANKLASSGQISRNNEGQSNEKFPSGTMNEGSYSELRPVFANLNSSKHRLEHFDDSAKNITGGESTAGRSSGENSLLSSLSSSPSSSATAKYPGALPRRKEQARNKVPSPLPSQYFKSLLKERLLEMLEDKIPQSSATMGTSTQGFSQLTAAAASLANSASHPFSRRRQKFPMVKTARKSSGSGTFLASSASKAMPTIVEPPSSPSKSSKQQTREHSSQRPRSPYPNGGGILSAIKRLFSFGRQEPALRKHSNMTMLDSSRMRKRTGEFLPADKKSIPTAPAAAVETTTTSTTPTPMKNNNEEKKSTEDSTPLHLKYGFKSANEFEKILSELLKAKRATEGANGGAAEKQHYYNKYLEQRQISSEKMQPIPYSDGFYYKGNFMPVMGLDRMKWVPDHAFMSRSSYYKSPVPVSWAKSMPINVIPSPSLSTSNYFPARSYPSASYSSSYSSASNAGRPTTKNNPDTFLISANSQKTGKLLPVISKWKPIPDSSSSFLSAAVSQPSGKATATAAAAATTATTASPLPPSYSSPIYKTTGISPTVNSVATATTAAKLSASNTVKSQAEHLIRPRSLVGA